MKIKTSELTGAALDWAVAKCLTGGELFQCGRVAHQVVLHSVGGTTAPYFMKDSGVIRCAFEPSENWAQGGPIIEREKIGSLHEARGVWSASTKWDDPAKVFYGKTKLIASMRCYVASKLGAELEIPNELIGE